MPEREDEGYQVIDKRRVRAEPAAEPAPPAAAEAPPAATETGAAEPETTETTATTATGDELDEEELDQEMAEAFAAGGGQPTSALDLVQMCIGMLNEIAWVKMGMVPDPMSGTLGADLPQAQLAIDCAADLAHRLERHVDARTQRDLQTLIQNLKLNFVRRSVEG
jgi:hypothetical protein